MFSTSTSHFRIGEAARRLGISTSSLRSWERMGLVLSSRSSSGYRLYSPELLNKLRRIRSLRTVRRINPAGIAAIFQNEETKREVGAAYRQGQQALGRWLAEKRRERRLTLAMAASACRVSASLLSSIERGYNKASVAILHKLASLYQMKVLPVGASSRRLVRAKGRNSLELTHGVRTEWLADGGRAIEPRLLQISPGAGSVDVRSHQGVGFIDLLKGKLEVWLDDVERYVLQSGDSLYFENALHRWQNVSQRETLLLWIAHH